MCSFDQHERNQHMDKFICNTHRIKLSYSKMHTKNIVLTTKGTLIKSSHLTYIGFSS